MTLRGLNAQRQRNIHEIKIRFLLTAFNAALLEMHRSTDSITHRRVNDCLHPRRACVFAITCFRSFPISLTTRRATAEHQLRRSGYRSASFFRDVSGNTSRSSPGMQRRRTSAQAVQNCTHQRWIDAAFQADHSTTRQFDVDRASTCRCRQLIASGRLLWLHHNY